MRQLRQGDVLLVRVAARPAGGRKVAREDGRIVLALGEVTGHAHVIDAPAVELYETADGVRYLDVTAPAAVVHEEHAAVDLEPGVYEVRLQREYAPAARPRRVAD